MFVYTGLLSRPSISRLRYEGHILIDPFVPENLGTNSYDVTLGEWYWKEKSPDGSLPSYLNNTLYNIYDEEHVGNLWKKCRAQPAKEVFHHEFRKGKIKNIEPDDKIILLKPQEAILGHTIEFIGGCTNCVTTHMAARSTIGRNFLEVARCAGVGDVSYCDRWTLELTNNSRFHTIPLVVGRRIGQVIFYYVEPVDSDLYSDVGKYQPQTVDLEEMRAIWKPEDMLPKAYLDREVLGNAP